MVNVTHWKSCVDYYQDALHCTFVVAIEDAHFLSILSVPDMDSTIR